MERKKPIIRTAKAGDLPTREQIIENDKKLVEYMKENGDWEEFKKVMKNLAKMYILIFNTKKYQKFNILKTS
ncbi:hypothetical protein C4M81_01610 [Mycoplasmopsis pullorum]|uniref:hypothetical protein n=1 Tax=Mycoplasmopsis pullorum TaxID=48003 RepID=UPI00111B49DA|nr:hypothetical protein [Mycoplasmopsis pullorum]TNK84688.1 hypothetical protein C4M81_01610 [Mycoplasmopsis pullorum]